MLKSGSVQELLERLRAAAATLGASTPHEAGGSGGGDDVLFQALSDVSRHYGLSFRPHAIRAGIALVSGRLPLEHLPQAASRAGLEAEVVRLQIASLAAGPFPLLLVHTDRSADIVWDYDTESGALLSAPGSPDARARIAPDELSRIWTGSAVRFKPAPRAEDRRGAEAIASSRPDWFLPAFRMSRRVYAEAITATLALNVLALAMPLFTMNVYDRVLPNAAAETLWALAIGVLLATGFDFLIKTLRGRFVDHAARRADVVLSSLIFSRVLGARLQGGAQSAGVRANTLREYETLREFYNSATLTTFGDLPFLALFVLMTWVVGGSLVLVLLVAIPVVLAIAWATQRHLVALSETSFRDAAQKSAVAVEALSTLETIKAARAESFVAAKWERAVADQVRSSTQIRHISNLGINAVHVSQSVAQVLMIVVGFYMVAAGTLTTGALIAATMLAGRALQPLAQIAGIVARLHQARLSHRSLTAIVEAPQERPDDAELISDFPTGGAIAFEDVVFGYDPDGPPALRGVSFSIAPGERVGIVGPIGTGKSTVLRLVHGLHLPRSGRVLVGGIPTNLADPSALRARIGYAMQQADLFHGTIRSNLAMTTQGASDADLMSAAQAATLADWALRLPKGFDTPVRERGAGLSGGQRQTVALARALVGVPPIVLLDEPTSELDTNSEREVVARLRRDLDGRTVLLVTHRPALLDLVDRLIVIDNGKVHLDGPKGAVLASLASGARTRAAGAGENAR
jgi:ATP-binding cassette subfamily C protein LapB